MQSKLSKFRILHSFIFKCVAPQTEKWYVGAFVHRHITYTHTHASACLHTNCSLLNGCMCILSVCMYACVAICITSGLHFGTSRSQSTLNGNCKRYVSQFVDPCRCRTIPGKNNMCSRIILIGFESVQVYLIMFIAFVVSSMKYKFKHGNQVTYSYIKYSITYNIINQMIILKN